MRARLVFAAVGLTGCVVGAVAVFASGNWVAGVWALIAGIWATAVLLMLAFG
jgi:hypothetical protein